VPKSEFARRDYYDVWYPMLSPTPELVAQALAVQRDEARHKADKGPDKKRDSEAGETDKADEKAWRAFVKQFRAEMAAPEASRTLDLLAALSHQTNFSLGCYCEDEARCHRSVLRELLKARGAAIE
jgi:uncharacterized protein YeaO (DUF488 family)